MMNQTKTTQANRQSTRQMIGKKSFNHILIATAAFVFTAGTIGASFSSSATASTNDYRSYGFKSQNEMKGYLTIGSTELHEIPTAPTVLHEIQNVTINVGPIQIGGGNTATNSNGAPVTTTPTTNTPGSPNRPPLSAPGVQVPTGTPTTTITGATPTPTPGASPAPAPATPTASATPAPKPQITVPLPGAGTIGGIDPAQIMPWIAIGEKIWALIAANKPVVSVQTKRAFILPVAQQDWTQMENWKGPSVHTYRLEYKNLYGITVIRHTYTVAFNYGGSFNDQGQFLANVTVIPSKVDVAWGYTLNTSVELGEAVNTGSKTSPIPGIELQILTKVDTVLKHAETRDAFFVKGSGECMPLTATSATLVP